MGLHRTSPTHPKIGSVAMRMLWIPAIALLFVGGYLELRAPQAGLAMVTVVATAQAAAPVVTTASPTDTTAHLPETASALSDEATAAHEALDPVGAGHDNAR